MYSAAATELNIYRTNIYQYIKVFLSFLTKSKVKISKSFSEALEIQPEQKRYIFFILFILLSVNEVFEFDFCVVPNGFYGLVTVSAPASLSECKFSLHYPHKISCLLMRIRQMNIHNNL